MNAIDYVLTLLQYWVIFMIEYCRILSIIWFYKCKQYIFQRKQYKPANQISPTCKGLWVLGSWDWKKYEWTVQENKFKKLDVI